MGISGVVGVCIRGAWYPCGSRHVQVHHCCGHTRGAWCSDLSVRVHVQTRTRPIPSVSAYSCCSFSFPGLTMCSALSRCLFPVTTSSVLFAEVILADIFTSFAKVLGDFWVSFWMLLPGNSLFIRPPDSDWRRWIVPSIMRYIPRILVSVAKCTQVWKSALLSAVPSMSNRVFSSLQWELSTPVQCFEIRNVFSGYLPFCGTAYSRSRARTTKG